MLAVLGLGAEGGEEIVLASDAEGADAALDRLAKLVAEGWRSSPRPSDPRDTSHGTAWRPAAAGARGSAVVVRACVRLRIAAPGGA